MKKEQLEMLTTLVKQLEKDVEATKDCKDSFEYTLQMSRVLGSIESIKFESEQLVSDAKRLITVSQQPVLKLEEALTALLKPQTVTKETETKVEEKSFFPKKKGN